MFDLVIKVGNQPGGPDGGWVDGMPVTICPTGTAYSAKMKQAFAIITLPDAMLLDVQAALEPHREGDTLTHIRSGYFDLSELETALGVPGLVADWRGFEVGVEPQDGSGLDASYIHASHGHEWPDVPDLNAITAGPCTIGLGGSGVNYINWVAFLADIGSLTGDIYADQVADTTGEGFGGFKSLFLNGHVLTCTCSASHGGDPTAGYKSTVTTSGALLAFNCIVAAGIVEIEKLRVVYAAPSGGYGIIHFLVGTASTVMVHDNIIEGDSNSYSMVGIQVQGSSAGPNVQVWNNEVFKIGNFVGVGIGINVLATSIGTYRIENNTVHDIGQFGFSVEGGAYFNNCAVACSAERACLDGGVAQ